MKRMIFVVLAACGSEKTNQTDASTIDSSSAVDTSSSIDTPTSAFTLTSTAYAEGGVIPDAHSCAGANTSPPLAWTGGPAAMSYAIVFTDMSNGLVHSAIYDIPGTVTSLPADVDKAYAPADVPGAHQTVSYQMGVRGYNGPCPQAGQTHTYQFAIYALDANPLPGTMMSTTRAQLVPIIMQHDLAMATLTATFTRN